MYFFVSSITTQHDNCDAERLVLKDYWKKFYKNSISSVNFPKMSKSCLHLKSCHTSILMTNRHIKVPKLSILALPIWQPCSLMYLKIVEPYNLEEGVKTFLSFQYIYIYIYIYIYMYVYVYVYVYACNVCNVCNVYMYSYI